MENINSDIPREIQDIIIDLTIIAGIPMNCKLNICTGKYVSATSIIDNFLRWWGRHESRDRTVDFIKETIQKAIAICKIYPEWTKRMSEYVNNINDAIINLEQTYAREHDISTVARLKLIRSEQISKDSFFYSCSH